MIKNYDEIGDKIISKINIEDLKVEKYKKIYNKILEIVNNGNNTNIYKEVTNIEDEEFQSVLSEILFSEYEINSVEKFADEIINNYEKNKLNDRKLEILEEIKIENLDNDKKTKLENELNEIIIKLAKIK